MSIVAIGLNERELHIHSTPTSFVCRMLHEFFLSNRYKKRAFSRILPGFLFGIRTIICPVERFLRKNISPAEETRGTQRSDKIGLRVL